MTDEKQLGLLKDILLSACAIQRYISGVTYEEFVANVEKQDAVLRRFEVMGEAASRLSPETKNTFPQLPFRAMRGMRNIIAHDYGAVDIDQVWQTAAHDLTLLIATLQPHVGEA